MMKLLELASRASAILGVLVLIFAGCSAQTAGAQTVGEDTVGGIGIIIPIPGICKVGGGGTTCINNPFGACDIGCCQTAPAVDPNGRMFCCYKVNQFPIPC